MSLKTKDKKFIYLSVAVVSVFIVLLLGGFIAIATLNYFIQENDYVLCNVFDLKKSNEVLYGNADTDYKDYIRVNLTQGVISDGNS